VQRFMSYGINSMFDVSVRSHVSETVSSCFAALRRTESIRRQAASAVFTGRVARRLEARLGKRRLFTIGAEGCGTPRAFVAKVMSLLLLH